MLEEVHPRRNYASWTARARAKEMTCKQQWKKRVRNKEAEGNPYTLTPPS